ncbi:MAG: hypothetical protein KJO24_02245, partial [Gammaproteobacteria bacterium]|nr:hypothetical protein [Gammaproteobacteria bacterium]
MESYINSLLGADVDSDKARRDPAPAAHTGESDAAAGDLQSSARPLLPFPFAKRFGAYVLEDSDALTLFHKESIQPSVVAEIQRFLGRPFGCAPVAETEFESRLAQAYESRNNEAMQMVEDLGDEMDLASLA